MDRLTYVNVIPSNQTLILASERDMTSGSPSTAPARALINTANQTALQRITIVLAPVTRLPARISPQPPNVSPYSSSRGIELYASTQSILNDSPVAHIDVLA